MSDGIHLSIVTPSAKLIDIENSVSVRADDESGSFGILKGHTDFLTVLIPSVVRWRDAQGAEHYCIVDGGILTVRGGIEVAIACRQGKIGEDIDRLHEDIAAMRAEQADAARNARVEQTQLHANAVRQLMRLMRMSGDTAGPTLQRRTVR
jgi:F-type H+-transporting ATPase subunit epsilon